ncbi:hypothetical protein THAOC_35007, partial [Thalassiosira oceanica]
MRMTAGRANYDLAGKHDAGEARILVQTSHTSSSLDSVSALRYELHWSVGSSIFSWLNERTEIISRRQRLRPR